MLKDVASLMMHEEVVEGGHNEERRFSRPVLCLFIFCCALGEVFVIARFSLLLCG